MSDTLRENFTVPDPIIESRNQPKARLGRSLRGKYGVRICCTFGAFSYSVQ
jgi:hypothetical protein